MSQRIPKHEHPKKMCYTCKRWKRGLLDFGECKGERKYAYSTCRKHKERS